MVAAGYIIETVIAEVLMICLFSLSVAEAINATLPKNRKRIKKFQKIVIPGTMIYSFCSAVLAIDHRGVFGIYTNSRSEIWMPFVFLLPITPMLGFGIVWVAQMYLTACRVTGVSAAFGLTEKTELLRSLEIVYSVVFIAFDIVTAVLVVITNQMRYAALLFGPVTVVTGFSVWATRKCQLIMVRNEILPDSMTQMGPPPNNRGGPDVIASQDSSTGEDYGLPIRLQSDSEKRRENIRKVMYYKITVGYLLSIGMCAICMFGFVYSFTPAGYAETVTGFVHPDPDNYSLSVIVLVAILPMVFFEVVSLVNLGLLCGRLMDFEEDD